MINITEFKPTFSNILLAVEKEEYVSILTQKVRTSTGGIIMFDFDHYLNSEGEMKTARELMNVVSVGPNCKLCQPGDIAIIDYTVDETEDLVVYEDERFKYFCLSEDRDLAPADHGVYNANGVWSKIYGKGDMIRESLIYGVIRNDKIICNENYVVFRPEDADKFFELNEAGLWIPKQEQGGDYMTLTIEFAPLGSKYKAGDKVMVPQYYTFTKNIQANAFLMAYEQDIAIEV